METKVNNKKVITISSVVLLFAAFMGTGLLFNSNKQLAKKLDDEKLKSEIQLSGKLSLQKEIYQLKMKFNSLEGQNAALDKIITQSKQDLTLKENEIKRLLGENANSKQIKKQLAELTKMKTTFEKQAIELNQTVQKVNSEKDAKDAIIASLKKENEQLAANLNILSSLTTDGYMVETTKRQNKLTVNAKRAKKMAISFKVPSNVVENLSFKVTKPNGELVQGKNCGISYKMVNDSYSLTASLAKEEIKISKKIEMIYEPKEKLKAGVYQIEMYNGEKYIGSCNIKLR